MGEDIKQIGKCFQCYVCLNVINDKLVAMVNNKPVHDQCLRCNECNHKLSERCFEINGVYFCPEHYIRKKFPKCNRCDGPIFPADLVYFGPMVTTYHHSCFKCSICNRLLTKGDKYMSQRCGQTLLCEKDFGAVVQETNSPNKDEEICGNNSNMKNELCYDQSIYNTSDLIQNTSSHHSFHMCDETYTSDADQSFDDICSSEDKNSEIRRRTPRTTIKSNQLDSLKATFAITPKPTRQMRERLAETTGLSMRVIQVWFQNRRSKERRSRLSHQKRMKNEKYEKIDFPTTNISYKDKDKVDPINKFDIQPITDHYQPIHLSKSFIPVDSLLTTEKDNNFNWITNHQLDSTYKSCQLF